MFMASNMVAKECWTLPIKSVRASSLKNGKSNPAMLIHEVIVKITIYHVMNVLHKLCSTMQVFVMLLLQLLLMMLKETSPLCFPFRCLVLCG